MIEIKLTNTVLKIKNYNTNLEVFVNDECICSSYDLTELHEFTTEENIDDFIDIITNKGNLEMNDEDKEKTHYELHNIFYSHSSEVRS